MKFRSSVAGYVLGVRFYKGPLNIGTHTGEVWTKGGTLLAQVTFGNETASGWQQANFSTPVAVAANTTYVISYWSPASHYSSNVNYFESSGITNGPLYALRNGQDGGNGVYRYNRSNFPTKTSNSTNYWVDIVFNMVPSTTPTDAPLLLSTTTNSDLVAASAAGDGGGAMTPTETAASAALSLSCSPKSVNAGDSFQCELRLGQDRPPEDGSIPVEASSSDVRIPAFVNARTGQRRIIFHGSIDPAAAQSSIIVSAGEGDRQVKDQITILPSSSPVLTVPDSLLVKLGEPVSFTVSATDGSELPVQLSASKLPAGGSFQHEEGRLSWTPDPSQLGDRELAFTAANSAGVSSATRAYIHVGSGLPTLTGSQQAACSPGAIASLNGRWLSQDPGGTRRSNRIFQRARRRQSAHQWRTGPNSLCQPDKNRLPLPGWGDRIQARADAADAARHNGANSNDHACSASNASSGSGSGFTTGASHLGRDGSPRRCAGLPRGRRAGTTRRRGYIPSHWSRDHRFLRRVPLRRSAVLMHKSTQSSRPSMPPESS